MRNDAKYKSSSRQAQRKAPQQRNKSQRNRKDSRYDNKKSRTDRAEDSKSTANVKRSFDDLQSLNDISWYSRYPDLLAATANIPFPYRPGMTINYGNVTVGSGSTAKSVPYNLPIPGVMTLSWIPSIGYAASVLDPINVAAKELYARVRAAFSGSLAVDPPDFMVYLAALDSVFSYIGALKRIYRILDAYTPNNYAIPKQLLRALGVRENEWNSLIQAKPQFLAYINELIYQTRKFQVPAVMDYFNRHYWMNDNAYTDAATINSQIFVFRQDAYFKFTLNSVVGATDIKAGGLTLFNAPWCTSHTTDITASTLYTYGQDLIKALAESEDGYTISGYLMRAYEGVPNFTVDLLTGAEEFSPVYSEEVLMQIENSAGVVYTQGSLSAAYQPTAVLQGSQVSQSVANNTLVWQPQLVTTSFITPTGTNAIIYQQPTFSLRTDVPTAADVVIASRLHPTLAASMIIAGTEIPLYWILYQTLATGTIDEIPLNYCNTTTGAGSNFDIRQLKVLSFDWHPIMFGSSSPLGDEIQIIPIGDIHNITKTSFDQLKEIHRICVLSEFNAYNV